MAMAAREVAEACVDVLGMELVAAYGGMLGGGRPDLAGRRIEAIGFQVGQQLAERPAIAADPLLSSERASERASSRSRASGAARRYTKERPRFADHLDVIKFICKDFWAEVFKKQVDNLKTNHRGVFVLQDNRFRWLTRISPASTPPHEGPATKEGGPVSATQAAGQYLYFPCGLIRGVLTSLGVPCAVSAEIATLPACSFTVRIKS
eukprot:SM000008S22258  [mRNA]  locus=s8:761298:762747:+ [translate_table: standard]